MKQEVLTSHKFPDDESRWVTGVWMKLRRKLASEGREAGGEPKRQTAYSGLGKQTECSLGACKTNS